MLIFDFLYFHTSFICYLSQFRSVNEAQDLMKRLSHQTTKKKTTFSMSTRGNSVRQAPFSKAVNYNDIIFIITKTDSVLGVGLLFILLPASIMQTIAQQSRFSDKIRIESDSATASSGLTTSSDWITKQSTAISALQSIFPAPDLCARFVLAYWPFRKRVDGTQRRNSGNANIQNTVSLVSCPPVNIIRGKSKTAFTCRRLCWLAGCLGNNPHLFLDKRPKDAT